MRSAIIENGVVVNVMVGEIPGSVECDPEVGKGWTYSGGVFAAPVVPEPEPEPITPRHIDAERDRRLAAGAVVNVSGYGDVAIQGRQIDIAIYTNLAVRASALIQAGDDTPMAFRDRDNVMHSLTPAQMAELMTRAGAAADAIYASAWALKDADPIPQDYADDENWP